MTPFLFLIQQNALKSLFFWLFKKKTSLVNFSFYKNIKTIFIKKLNILFKLQKKKKKNLLIFVFKIFFVIPFLYFFAELK